jgi:hypothetical protein
VCTGPGKVKTQCKKNDQNEVKSQKIEEKGKLKEGGASDPDTLGLGWQNPTPKTGGFSAESTINIAGRQYLTQEAIDESRRSASAGEFSQVNKVPSRKEVGLGS